MGTTTRIAIFAETAATASALAAALATDDTLDVVRIVEGPQRLGSLGDCDVVLVSKALPASIVLAVLGLAWDRDRPPKMVFVEPTAVTDVSSAAGGTEVAGLEIVHEAARELASRIRRLAAAARRSATSIRVEFRPAATAQEPARRTSTEQAPAQG